MPDAKRILLVFNPSAGVGRSGLDAYSVSDRLRRTASVEGVRIDMEVRRTSGKGDCLDAAKEAAGSGVDVLAAAGGDGTVMEAASGIAFSRTALGIVPVGSGNDTLFSLSGHRDMGRSLRDIVLDGRRSMDMGSLDGRLFLNVVGIGLDAEVNHEVARKRHHVLRYGPLFTYALAALKVVGHFKPYDVEVAFEGEGPAVHSVGLFTVGNGTTCGGGFRLTPLARMDDGLLDVSICRHVGRLRSVLNIRTAMKGEHIRKKETTYRRTRGLRVRGMDRELPYHVDGEGGSARELKISIVPSCLRTVH
ncbi:MAG: YegS/Rv2252/BmrU family lipid kinase [Candidatus Thermoplasmatota archaeon]|jgi:YegS/Rv2252/BmrU family lipid kinase|nr:YegS/Rv2252/BmrU family lipid kinase [Candidatus Thermoplasmatota archaeon]